MAKRRKKKKQRQKKKIDPRQEAIKAYNRIARSYGNSLAILQQEYDQRGQVNKANMPSFSHDYYGISQDLFLNPPFLRDEPADDFEAMVKEEFLKAEGLTTSMDILSIEGTEFDYDKGGVFQGLQIFYYSNRFSDEHIHPDNYYPGVRLINGGVPFIARTQMRLAFHRDPSKCVFWGLAINPKYHGRGIGRRLVGIAENIAKRVEGIGAVYLKPPILSIPFWRKMGYDVQNKMDWTSKPIRNQSVSSHSQT